MNFKYCKFNVIVMKYWNAISKTRSPNNPETSDIIDLYCNKNEM